MKLVVSSIALSLNEITQTDRQKSGNFHHTDRNEVDRDYAIKQIGSIIRKHQKSFLPAHGAFTTKLNYTNDSLTL